MSQSPDSRQFERLRFMARVTAGVTHELNNVMAVTNEVVGLLGDMLEDLDPAAFPGHSKLGKIHDRLLAQVSRGRISIKRLNTFVHTADNPIISFDLNSVMENLVGLCGRPADMKKVKLLFRPSDEPIVIEGSPYLLQMAVYDAILWILESGPGGTLVVETGCDGSQARVELGGFAAGKEACPACSAIEDILNEMSGRLVFSADDNAGRLTFLLPVGPTDRQKNENRL